MGQGRCFIEGDQEESLPLVQCHPRDNVPGFSNSKQHREQFPSPPSTRVTNLHRCIPNSPNDGQNVRIREKNILILPTSWVTFYVLSQHELFQMFSKIIKCQGKEKPYGSSSLVRVFDWGRTWGPEKMKWVAQGHTDKQVQSCGYTPGLLTLQAMMGPPRVYPLLTIFIPTMLLSLPLPCMNPHCIPYI